MFAKFKQLAGQSSVYTFGEMLRTGLGFILLPVYTRALTPADYGILGVTAPIFALLSTGETTKTSCAYTWAPSAAF